MYALVALVPFALLATVMGLSWWEDRILPPPRREDPPVPVSTASATLPAASNPTPFQGH